MNIGITGYTGFIGKNLCRFLEEQGNRVIYINLRDESFEIQTDLDAVIHLAGKAHDLKNVSKDEEYIQVNTNLTINLFDLFKDSKVKTFIYFSSVKAVADKVIDKHLTEDLIPNPATAYGRSKLEAEKYILSSKNIEKEIFILRPCMVHGPDNKGNLNLLYNIVSKGLPWPLGAFNNKRSFLSIDNLNFIISKILKGKIRSGIYNLADTDPISTNQLVEIISNELGIKKRIYSIPKNSVKLFSRFGDYIPIPLNTERLEKLTENYVVSNRKILIELMTDLPVNSIDGIIKTIRSFNK